MLLYKCNRHTLYKAGTCVMVASYEELPEQFTGTLYKAGTNVRYGRSSHEELQEQFTDTPYKAGTCITVVYHTKNYQSSLLRLHSD